MRMCNYCGKVEYPLFCLQRHYLCKECKNKGVSESQAIKAFENRMIRIFGKKKAYKILDK